MSYHDSFNIVVDLLVIKRENATYLLNVDNNTLLFILITNTFFWGQENNWLALFLFTFDFKVTKATWQNVPWRLCFLWCLVFLFCLLSCLSYCGKHTCEWWMFFKLWGTSNAKVALFFEGHRGVCTISVACSFFIPLGCAWSFLGALHSTKHLLDFSPFFSRFCCAEVLFSEIAVCL